jgi:(1->4)-alpha-D-glucan 1-alpha-D-glucosylmutase
VEDTAFYRYNRFIALNEVGGSPQRFGLSLEEFHEQNQWRVEHCPATMLATATHDTKRGEDTRARLAALSELPDEWAEQLEPWSDILGKGMDGFEPAEPDRNDQYMFFQMLIGSWPVELLGTAAPDAKVLATFYERIKGALIKSVREAKVHSTWAAPNTQYESALLALAKTALDTSCSPSFFDAVRPFAARVASLGARNSLIQTVLKLTLPGVPDVYQGTELWDFSMVDPDNRRAIDYTLRIATLERVRRALVTDPGAAMHGLMHDWTDGSFKLATLTKLLELRRERPHLFAEGNYAPLPARGPYQEAICAFSRTHERQTIIVVVGRFPRRLESMKSDTVLSIPARHESTVWRELFTGEHGRITRGSLALTTGFAAFPAAIFVEDIEP